MNIKVFALGGLNEVGKNCYVIEKNEDLIIIDCGIKFLNDSYNLANGTIPDFAYLKENKARIKGLFITHGHEDHIGGIPFLLEEIGYDFPLYGSAFALALLKAKLGNKANLVKSTIFSDDTEIYMGEFRVSFFRVTHSIPGSFGLIIEVLREGREEEKKLFNFMKRDISKIILTTFASNETRKLKSQRDSEGNKHDDKKKPYNLSSDQSKEIHWELIIDYENGNTKVLTSLQSETFLSDFSKLRVIDVKNYLEKINKNSITRQELDTFLFNVRIVMTGDFKFDWTEIGEKTDLVKLTKAGKKGVDLLLSDSTNAEIPGTTPTEQKVISRLETIIFQALGRVIITSFASNVYRLKKIIEIAKKCGRKILLLGSSLSRYMKVIQKVSLWKIDKSVFIDPLLEKKIDSNKLIIFCTGSQGEAKAVLSRLAHQVYPGWKIRLGDTIILTSSPIMNNRYNLEAINNKLTELGAIIYENSKEELLHASGHACQEDLKLMLTLVKPRYFMPFHGDFRMLKAHRQLAQEIGVLPNNIFICQNGEVVQTQKEVKFSEKKTFSVPRQEKTSSAIHKTQFFLTSQKVPANPNYVFGSKIIPEGRWKENLCLRQQMSQFGVIVIIFFYNQVQKKFVMPCFFTYGFLNMEKNKNLVQNWKERLCNLVNELKKIDSSIQLKEKVETKMLELLSYDLPKSKPLIVTLVENL